MCGHVIPFAYWILALCYSSSSSSGSSGNSNQHFCLVMAKIMRFHIVLEFRARPDHAIPYHARPKRIQSSVNIQIDECSSVHLSFRLIVHSFGRSFVLLLNEKQIILWMIEKVEMSVLRNYLFSFNNRQRRQRQKQQQRCRPSHNFMNVLLQVLVVSVSVPLTNLLVFAWISISISLFNAGNRFERPTRIRSENVSH